ncbi:MAG: hypothetical protein RR543_00340 [Erysipelotrichales bacterium]
MIDITKLEQRVDLALETHKIISFMNQDNLFFQFSPTSLWKEFDKTFISWGKRGMALNTLDYLKYQEIYFENRGYSRYSLPEQELKSEQYLFILVFIKNYIHDVFYSTVGENKLVIDSIIDNIDLIVEKCNYQFHYVNTEDKYILCKRDENVDSIIQFTKENNLSNILLTYLDMSNYNNVFEKTHILMDLHKYIEPKRQDFSSKNSTLTNKVFSMYNKLQVRHNDNKQIDLPDDEKIKWYDILFQMTLHLIRTPYIIDLQSDVSELISEK